MLRMLLYKASSSQLTALRLEAVCFEPSHHSYRRPGDQCPLCVRSPLIPPISNLDRRTGMSHGPCPYVSKYEYKE